MIPLQRRCSARGCPHGKIAALQHDPRVAVTIDANEWPYKVLLVRGRAVTEEVEGIAPEYAAAAGRYFGEEQGAAWVNQVKPLAPTMTRIKVKPEWAAIIDFEQRFPSAIARKMAAATSG